MSRHEERINAITAVRTAAESLRALGKVSIERNIHTMHADRLIGAVDLSSIQSDWNSVEAHLDVLIATLNTARLSVIDEAWDDKVSSWHNSWHNDPKPEPDPDGDRDYPGPEICPQCDHRLRLDSEGRCCACGYC
jgi:hypothetical protein